MRDRYEQIRRLGAELVVVGNGQPFHARAFAEDYAVDFPLYVDPDLEAYAAAGLRRGAATVLRPGVLVNAVRALRTGNRQGKVQGDPWQQGGTFVITPQGEVPFEHVSREAGEHANPDAVIAALRGYAAR